MPRHLRPGGIRMFRQNRVGDLALPQHGAAGPPAAKLNFHTHLSGCWLPSISNSPERDGWSRPVERVHSSGRGPQGVGGHTACFITSRPAEMQPAAEEKTRLTPGLLRLTTNLLTSPAKTAELCPASRSANSLSEFTLRVPAAARCVPSSFRGPGPGRAEGDGRACRLSRSAGGCPSRTSVNRRRGLYA